MTPRENMRRAIEFRGPQRLPITGYGDADDRVSIGTEPITPPAAANDPLVDEWLCRWEKTETPNMGQVKGHPLADLADLHSFPWPDGDDPRRYVNVTRQLDEIDAAPVRRDKYRIVGIFMLLWERMQALYGFENCSMDLLEDRPEIHELADRLVAYDCAFIRNVHRLAGDRIDGFGFSEDWGTEQDLMVSPELFRRFFLPRYRTIFAAARDRGWHVWMHSCGKINRAIPFLIDAGVNLLNMQQPLTNGIAEIGRQFAGRVCFETLCDIQHTLPKGNRAEIRQQAEQLLTQWGTPQGGFILGDNGDAAAIGAELAIKSFMFETFRELDPWRNGGRR